MTTNATIGTRGSKQHFHNKVFGWSHPESMPILHKITTGAPAIAAPCIGCFCYNDYDDDYYICTVISGTWVKINA